MISFCLQLTEKGHAYLHSVKREFGLSMGSQLRLLLRNEMLGINSGGSSLSGPMDTRNNRRPVRGGPSSAGQAAVVAELSRVFEKRRRRKLK